MQIRFRSVAACIILTILTCSIYSLFWIARLNDDVAAVAGEHDTAGVTVVLLSIVTCGIYLLYWSYKTGDKLDRARAYNNVPTGHLGILFLLLGIFSLGIISLALAQNEVNKYASVA